MPTRVTARLSTARSDGSRRLLWEGVAQAEAPLVALVPEPDFESLLESLFDPPEESELEVFSDFFSELDDDSLLSAARLSLR